MSRATTRAVQRGRSPAGHATEGPQSCDVLLGHVAAGDHEAFAALYDRLGEIAHRVARRVVLDPALADEAIQEAFLYVWLKAATFDPSRGSARAWVLTITRHRAVDTFRREESNRDRLTRSPVCATDRAYDMVLDQVLERAAADAADMEVTRALAALTPLQREAVELAHFEGFTCAEVAGMLGVPLSTAKTRMRAGMRRLAAELRPAPSRLSGA